MFLLSVKPSTREDKRYMATYCLCRIKNSCRGSNHKVINFGQPGATTYVDGADEAKKKSYLARHSKSPGQDWSKPDTPGSLARYILWGATRSLRENIKKFRDKFNL